MNAKSILKQWGKCCDRGSGKTVDDSTSIPINSQLDPSQGYQLSVSCVHGLNWATGHVQTWEMEVSPGCGQVVPMEKDLP